MNSLNEQRRMDEEEERRRLVRVESKLTNLMSHLGVNHYHDVKEQRRNCVFVVDGDVHTTTPDTKVTWLYDAMLDAGLDSADLYVAGVYRGQIVLNKQGVK